VRETQFIAHDSSARHPDIGKPNPGKTAVSKKIGHLVREGTPQRQAVAMAMSMQRAGRLTKSGDYKRVGR